MDKDERKKNMLYLRETLTLQEIGDMYNISSERVRQIIGNTGWIHEYKGRSQRAKYAQQNLHMSNKELADEMGVSEGTVSKYRRGLRNWMGGNYHHTSGFIIEEWAARKIEQKGSTAELMPNGHPFDISVNGYKIDVKYRSKPSMPQSRNGRHISPVWIFSTIKKNKKREIADYFFCVTGFLDVFIIPRNIVPINSNLTFAYPTLRPEISKYIQYKDRYDLLLGGNDEI